MKRKKVSELNLYELLNLPVTATNDEIQQAYLNAVSIYSVDSIASYRALDNGEREWMIGRLRTAYETLSNSARRADYDITELQLTDKERETLRENARRKEVDRGRIRRFQDMASATPPSGAVAANIPARRITGATLRDIRKAKGASLEEISEITKVKKAYLEAIEREDVDCFPAPVFMKGFLKNYAKALGLDPDEILEKYMAGK